MTGDAGRPRPGPETGQLRAWRSPRAWAVLLVVLAAGLAIDLGLKHWSFQNVAPRPVDLDPAVIRHPAWRIPNHEPVRLLPGLLNLHLVKNDGAVFGIGANQRLFFVVFTVGALGAAIFVFARWTMIGAASAHVAIGLILAGGVGNLYDRVRYGFVRDFLHMLPGWKLPFGWHWPGGADEVFPWVFNTADVMLLVGMGLLILYMNRLEKQRKEARTARAEQSGQPQPESV